MSEIQTIDIDCPPMTPRPDAYIRGVLKDTPLEKYLPRKPVSMFFGNWKWNFTDVPVEEWKEANPTIAERLTVLYKLGHIRYASW